MAENLDQDIPTGTQNITSTVGEFKPASEENPDTATRRGISYALFALLTGVIVVAFIALFLANSVNNSTDAAADAERLIKLINIIFGPVVTLFSSVVGFYFGARTAKEGGA
jgi:Ca2+/H+ antiporter